MKTDTETTKFVKTETGSSRWKEELYTCVNVGLLYQAWV